MSLEVIILFLISIVTIVYLWFWNVFSYWKNRNVPHEKPIFPFGNAKGFTKTKNFIDLTKPLYEKFKDKNPFCGLYLFIRPMAVLTDLNLIKQVLIKDFQYFTGRGAYYNEKVDPLSGHLFLLDGAAWKTMRIKLTPTFTSGKMKFMYPTILQVAGEFINVLKNDVKTTSNLEIKDYLSRFTTDVIGTCAFGIECNSLKDPDVEFRQYGKRTVTSLKHGPVLRLLADTFPNIARFFGMKLFEDDISNFFINIVKQTVTYREKNGVKRNDFMNILLEMKNSKDEMNHLTVEQIAAQVFLFFIAGFETSSTTMGYALYEIAKNQDIQEKMRNEISAVLTKHNGEFTYEAMKEMKYVAQVINETLRKYPVLSILVRQAIKDYQVPNTDLVIEKSTAVIIPVHAIHYDPEIYPNPEVFDPERFSPEESENRHPCPYLPFGEGPRNCIGLRFGKMQVHVGLVTLLRNFRFNTCSATQDPLKFTKKDFILSAEGGIHLKIENL